MASHPLSAEQAQVRLVTHGPNVLAKDQRPGIVTLLLHSVLNPIVILLAVLSSVSLATGDYRAASMMILMIMIGVGLKLFQEAKADIRQLTRYIVFVGPCSSIFDYTTFFMMLYVFGCWDVSTPEAAAHSASLFQTGWFVESLLTQTLIIHIIRTNKIPFLQSRASWPLTVMSAIVVAIGVGLPFSPLGRYLGFTPLPLLYWPLLAATVLGYGLLTHSVKIWLLRKNWI
ncbi:MAG: cation transporting ATPase C-terminal domain-containing protein [Planctomycetota bacterium]